MPKINKKLNFFMRSDLALETYLGNKNIKVIKTKTKDKIELTKINLSE